MPLSLSPSGRAAGFKDLQVVERSHTRQSLGLVKPPEGKHAGWNQRPYLDAEPANFLRYACKSVDRSVVITIDDGPDPENTPKVLDKLKEVGVTATFFLIVANAVAHPDVVKRIIDEGHTVGLHTYSHQNLTAVWDAADWDLMRKEVDDAAVSLEALTGQPVKYFRPPYGALNEGVRTYLWERGLTVVMWNTGCVDWFYRDATLEVPPIMHGISDAGAIVCMHDTQPSAVAEIEMLVGILTGKVAGTSPAAAHPLSTLEHCIGYDTGRGEGDEVPAAPEAAAAEGGNETAVEEAAEPAAAAPAASSAAAPTVKKAAQPAGGAKPFEIETEYPHGGSQYVAGPGR